MREGAKVASIEDYERLYRESIDDPEGFWRRQAERLDWIEPPTSIMRVDNRAAQFEWYGGGKLNACVNCVDRHLDERGEKTAILWAADEVGEWTWTASFRDSVPVEKRGP